MCAVVQCLTRDFLRLVNLLKSCNGPAVVILPLISILPSAGLLQKFVAKPANTQLSPADSRSLSMLILIVSLLCEHCDFDRLSEQREGMYELPPVKRLTQPNPPWLRRTKCSTDSLPGKQILHLVHHGLSSCGLPDCAGFNYGPRLYHTGSPLRQASRFDIERASLAMLR